MKRIILALACLFGTAALADRYDEVPGHRLGEYNVFLKGGIGGYTGGLNQSSAAGPTWGAAVDLQPWRMIGLELGYEGSRNAVSDNRADGVALTRNGADALLKLAPPLIEKVKPFVGIGLGASVVSVNKSSGGLYQNDLMEEVPVATGLEFNSGALTAGVRGTYRFLVDQQFAGNGGQGGGLLDIGATLGARF